MVSAHKPWQVDSKTQKRLDEYEESVIRETTKEEYTKKQSEAAEAAISKLTSLLKSRPDECMGASQARIQETADQMMRNLSNTVAGGQASSDLILSEIEKFKESLVRQSSR